MDKINRLAEVESPWPLVAIGVSAVLVVAAGIEIIDLLFEITT